MEELETLDAACALLDDALAAVEQARQRRDSALRLAFAAGVAIPALVERSGLGRSRVQEILGHPFGTVGRPKRR